MKVGDLVQNEEFVGIVLKAGINMWGEEVIPSGVQVLWNDGEIEVDWEDELEVIGEI